MTGPSEEQIAEWQRLADEATPGPWGWGGSGVAGGECGEVLIAKTDWSDVEGLSAEVLNRNRDNGRFIAAAREAVPALIARLAEVEGEVERWKSMADSHWDLHEQAAAERDEARAVVGRVEALINLTSCHLQPSTEHHCLELLGATFRNGAEWTEDMCCLPCRLRAALRGEAGEGRA
jgi:hypothetical protein